jgi:hypothetical protein
VKRAGTALYAKPKPTTDKPEKSGWKNGKLIPEKCISDFVLGENRKVVVEIKFARRGGISPTYIEHVVKRSIK